MIAPRSVNASVQLEEKVVEQWLAHIGKLGWIAITHNARIRYIPNERDAVIRHRVSLLVVVGKAPLKELWPSGRSAPIHPALSRFGTRNDLRWRLGTREIRIRGRFRDGT